MHNTKSRIEAVLDSIGKAYRELNEAAVIVDHAIHHAIQSGQPKTVAALQGMRKSIVEARDHAGQATGHANRKLGQQERAERNDDVVVITPIAQGS